MSSQVSTEAISTATERLADFALGLRYDDLPSDAVERTKALFLDFLGVACGGRAFADSSLPVLGAVRELYVHAGSQTTGSDGRGGQRWWERSCSSLPIPPPCSTAHSPTPWTSTTHTASR